MNLPNGITVARVAATPILFLLLLSGGFMQLVLAFLLFLTAAISDIWDGYLARRRGQITDFGKLADPIADKLLVIATFIPFYVVSHRTAVAAVDVAVVPWWQTLPMWVLLVVLGREVLITVFRGFAKHRGVVIPAGKYDWNRFEVELTASDARPLSGRLLVRWSDFFEGERLDIIPSITWRPSKYFLLALAYERNDIELDGGDFVVDLASARINLTFTPKLSWTTLVQYDNVSDTIGINSRVRWIVVPGSDLFLVLNQGLILDDGRLRRGVTEPRIKLSWTFRF